MKYTTVLLLIALSLRLSAQQHTSVLFLHRDFESSTSAIDYSFTTGVPVDKEAKCNQSKRLKTAGTVLIASGAGLAGTSLVLATAGVIYTIRHIDDYNNDRGEQLYISSGVIGGVGMLAIFCGIPTLAVGRAKDWKYCGGDTHWHRRHHAYISTNGTNLALNF
ncbi:MAG: hypothetical protein JST90_19470 [Bacteroidetes bacterium]|nr:hypothetical protein [Bacteroidota bacterium]